MNLLIMQKRMLGLIVALLLVLTGVSSPVWASDRQADHNTHSGNNGPDGPDGPPDDPEDDCDSGLGSPVFLKNMSLIWTEVDISLPGRPKLELKRVYNSFDSTESIFGKGWTGSCEERLVKVEDVLTPETDGVSTTQNVQYYVYFTKSGISYKFIANGASSYESPGALKTLKLQVLADRVRITKQDGSFSDFNLAGQIVSEVDRNGNAITYTYDGSALIRIADDNGRYIDLFYTAQGFVDYVTDYTNRTWDFEYDTTKGTLMSVTDPLLGVREYQYDMFTPTNSSQKYALLKRVEDETNRTIISVDYSTTTGKVQSYSDGQNTFTYTDLGNGTVRKTDSLNHIWEYTLDDLGRKTAVLRKKGSTGTAIVETYEYDNAGNLVRHVDGESNEFTYSFDSLNRLISSTTPEGSVNYSYDEGQDRPSGQDTISGRSFDYDYDANGNLIEVTDLDTDLSTQFSWSAQGDLLSITLPSGNQRSFTYNSVGLIVSMTDELSRTTAYTYTPRGQVASITDAQQQTISYRYDNLDRRIQEVDVLNGTTSYAFDLSGRLVGLTNAAGQTESYSYDSFGRLTAITHLDGTTTTKSYRADNMLATTVDRANHTISYNYDDYQRLSGRSGASIPTAAFSYDARGLILSADNGVSGGTVSYSYDGLGRRTSETSNGQTSSFTYNSNGEVATANIMGEAVAYSYGDKGLITSLDLQGQQITYSYDSANRIQQIAMPNGINTNFSFDVAGQLVGINFQNLPSGNLELQYDSLGRITSMTGGLRDKSFAYDSKGQLIFADYSDGTEFFSYDLVGNRTSNNAQFSVDNRLLSEDDYDYSYDANGNMVQKDNTATGVRDVYSYNGLNQMTSWQRFASPQDVTPIASASYLYDPFGRRIQKNVAGDITNFVWEGARLAGEYTSTSQRAYFYDEDRLSPVAFKHDGSLYYIHKDHISTPKYVTDSSGAMVWNADQNAFGERVIENGSIDFNLAFPGQYIDEETGLHYNLMRTYDPRIGRYLQSDPLGVVGGINTYTYASSKPTQLVDALGLEATGSWSQSPTLSDPSASVTNIDFKSPSWNWWGYIEILRVYGEVSGSLVASVFCQETDECDNTVEWGMGHSYSINYQGHFDVGPNVYASIVGLRFGLPGAIAANAAIIVARAGIGLYDLYSEYGQVASRSYNALMSYGPDYICNNGFPPINF